MISPLERLSRHRGCLGMRQLFTSPSHACARRARDSYARQTGCAGSARAAKCDMTGGGKSDERDDGRAMGRHGEPLSPDLRRERPRLALSRARYGPQAAHRGLGPPSTVGGVRQDRPSPVRALQGAQRRAERTPAQRSHTLSWQVEATNHPTGDMDPSKRKSVIRAPAIQPTLTQRTGPHTNLFGGTPLHPQSRH